MKFWLLCLVIHAPLSLAVPGFFGRLFQKTKPVKPAPAVQIFAPNVQPAISVPQRHPILVGAESEEAVVTDQEIWRDIEREFWKMSEHTDAAITQRLREFVVGIDRLFTEWKEQNGAETELFDAIAYQLEDLLGVETFRKFYPRENVAKILACYFVIEKDAGLVFNGDEFAISLERTLKDAYKTNGLDHIREAFLKDESARRFRLQMMPMYLCEEVFYASKACDNDLETIVTKVLTQGYIYPQEVAVMSLRKLRNSGFSWEDAFVDRKTGDRFKWAIKRHALRKVMLEFEANKFKVL